MESDAIHRRVATSRIDSKMTPRRLIPVNDADSHTATTGNVAGSACMLALDVGVGGGEGLTTDNCTLTNVLKSRNVDTNVVM